MGCRRVDGCGFRCGVGFKPSESAGKIQGGDDLHRHRRHGEERRRRRGDRGIDHQAGRGDPQLPADAGRHPAGAGRQLILWNGLNLELWFEKFFQNLSDVPGVVVSEGVEPMGIAEGPYTGKPNPHAWMSPTNALIYVDNIRDAFVKYDPANAETYKANAEAYKAEDRGDRSRRSATKLATIPRGQALAGVERRRFLLSRPRFRPEGALSVADQRRPAGHAAAGSQGHRRGQGKQDRRRLQRKHGVRQAGPAGRARDRRPIRRRALCQFAQRGGRPGADLYRPAARDVRHGRRRASPQGLSQ